jgi:tRNA pseudouridine55 synthase
VVREIKRRLGVAKVGHLGTLDPFATGLLPVCLGEGAKIVPFLNQEDKAYTGTIRLGVATDTLDPTGRVTETSPVPELTGKALLDVACKFVGPIEQVPPMHSALKRDGVPLYRLARRGIEVERPARKVLIKSLSLEIAGEALVGFEVRCSKGTYVRTLARDIAAALGTQGHLEILRRTAFGAFRVSEAVSFDAIVVGAELPVLGLRDALAGLRELTVDPSLESQIRLGQQQGLRSLPPPRSAGEVAKVISGGGDLIALVGAGEIGWKLLRVFERPAAARTRVGRRGGGPLDTP